MQIVPEQRCARRRTYTQDTLKTQVSVATLKLTFQINCKHNIQQNVVVLHLEGA